MNQKPHYEYFGNSEDPDEMPLNVAFYHGLHCLLRHNGSSEKEIYVLEIITWKPSWIWDGPLALFLTRIKGEETFRM